MERRTPGWDFSSLADALLAVDEGVIGLGAWVDLLGGAAMVVLGEKLACTSRVVQEDILRD